MEDFRGARQDLMARLYGRMVRLYPPRFQREFSGEIREVFLLRMDERGAGSALGMQEIAGLAWSILLERWHEWRRGKEAEMEDQDRLITDGGGASVIRAAVAPDNGSRWWLRWVGLNLAAIFGALLLVAPFTMPYRWIINLGTRAGWWPEVASTSLEILGFFTAFALLLAAGQWFMLRRLLPHPGRWFTATALGAWLSGMAVSVFFFLTGLSPLGPAWILGACLAASGLVLGLAQWLALRRSIAGAGWLVLIDCAAILSLFLFPRSSITNLAEMTQTLVALALPGAVSGLGVWLLLRHASRGQAALQQSVAPRAKVGGRWSITRWVLTLAAAAAVFFFMIWAYAASQLALAKDRGAYPTVEEAVIGYNSTGVEDAKVIGITDIQTGPNRSEDSQPYVRFGTARVQLDRTPASLSRPSYSAGSFYIHTREGWVLMGEGAFPEFIGWVMWLYNLEGVRQFSAAK